jgi:hypothetical protein
LATPKILRENVIQHIKGTQIAQSNYCVLIQHPIITQVELQSEHIRQTLEAIRLSGLHCFINYPNSDADLAQSSRLIRNTQLNIPKRLAYLKT